jgi:hypothetical protein
MDDFCPNTDLTDPVVQQRLFNEMIRKLEDAGDCRYVYHALAEKLWPYKEDE